jgi:hypothetical protein
MISENCVSMGTIFPAAAIPLIEEQPRAAAVDLYEPVADQVTHG